MSRSLLSAIKRKLGLSGYVRLSPDAKSEKQRDARGLPDKDPGIQLVVQESLNWLSRAQQYSKEQDGGIARHYGLNDGWGSSYPETSGYIVPTLLERYNATGDQIPLNMAIRTLDWLVDIQFPEGGFQGGTVNATPRVPVTFNTGQVLLGLAAATDNDLDKRYRESMHRAANWLRDSQDDDGAWRKHPTPFAAAGDTVYETHVAWGLLETARLAPNEGYAEAAFRNIEWALTHQTENGWFDHCCLDTPEAPLTHTLGYAVRGILEAWRFNNDCNMLLNACKTLDAIVACTDKNGYLAGRLNNKWQGTVSWSCLTGSSQLAYCLLMVYEHERREDYLDAAMKLNSYVRRTISVVGDDTKRGGVKGSFPVDGEYGRFQYLNWAAKFTIDANVMEQRIVATE